MFIGRAPLATKSIWSVLIQWSGSKVRLFQWRTVKNDLGHFHNLCFITAFCLYMISQELIQRDKMIKGTVQARSIFFNLFYFIFFSYGKKWITIKSMIKIYLQMCKISFTFLSNKKRLSYKGWQLDALSP